MAYIEGCDCAFCKVNDGRAEEENDVEAFITVNTALQLYLGITQEEEELTDERKEEIRLSIYQAE